MFWVAASREHAKLSEFNCGELNAAVFPIKCQRPADKIIVTLRIEFA
jgi:hypothetical protein